MIIVNTPQNPIGKVFTKEELEKIAVLSQEHNLLVMSDEVVCQVQLRHSALIANHICSMTVWYMTRKSTFASLIFPGCGIVQ